MSTAWILVAGYGSIGRRHFGNLRRLGYRDVRLLRRGTTPAHGFETPTGVREYRSLSEALADQPRVVIVCNPTSQHIETTRSALESGAHVLLEKPVGDDLVDARTLLDDVSRAEGSCSIAYCFRYHPLYRRLQEIVAEGAIGRLFHFRSWQASYLPNWHPWEDYHTGYAARSDLGGGVVRTLDHDLDMVRWIAGQPSSVMASTGNISGLDLEVEDTADLIFRFRDRMQAAVHLSFGRRDYTRGVTISGEEGSASLDWSRRVLELSTGAKTEEVLRLPADYDLNQMYENMLADALAAFSEDPPRAAIPVQHGVAALEMAEAALSSNKTQKAISIACNEWIE